MKIFQKLILSFLCACILPLVIFANVIYEVSARNIEASCMELAEIFSSQIVRNMEGFLQEYDRITKSILVNFDEISSLNQKDSDGILEEMDRQLSMRKIMVQIFALKPEIRGIALLAVNGRTYQLDTNGGTINGNVLREQEWLRNFQRTGKILSVASVHNRAYYDKNQDGLLITVCRRILDYKGTYVGDLLIDLDVESLIQLDESFLLARNEYNIKVCITDSENKLLFDSDVVSGRITWREAMEANDLLYERDASDFVEMSNETKDGNFKVSIVIPRSNLLFRVSKIKDITYGLVIGCVIVNVIISVKLSKNISNPVRRMQDEMKKIEKGQYEIIENNTDVLELKSLVDSYNNMVIKIRDLIEKVYVADIKQKKAKLMALQTQINPHMLYNTLEAVRMKAIVNDEDEIADMIQIIAQMFRMALKDDVHFYRIENDIEYAKKYVELQNIRLPNTFSIEIKMDDRVKQASIIPLIIQPIVENSITHGYRGSMMPLNMVLTGIIVEEGDILITLQDNGKGMTGEQLSRTNHLLSSTEALALREGDRRSSIGMQNIQERISLQYGEKYYLRIAKSDKTGTLVEILIPGYWE